ncbi:NACHT and WD repeat domain-containing protein [Streptomyces sp. NBC_00457]|uniref:NACHT and WD repeat domain-containing protein n=1 Tax=Streptomyces sp. NBC_00457 TaxID=2975748 RepID=UPI002E241BAA
MTRAPAPDTFARRLVVIAISDYDDGSAAKQQAFSKEITAQVTTVKDWWAHPSLDNARRFEPSEAKQLHDLRDLRTFLIEEDLGNADDDEALVVYITGHGLAPTNSPQHFLQLRDTYVERPYATAFPTAEIITTVLDSHATHVLVMVDSCFSGRLETELKTMLNGLRQERRALGSLVVLVAGNDQSTPRTNAFANILRAVRAHCEDKTNGFAEPHLSWQDWKGIVNEVFDESTMADLTYAWPTPSASMERAQERLSPCLPNPGHTGSEPVLRASSRQVGWTQAQLDTFWVSRATGASEQESPSWYFTGRTKLVKRILSFLTGAEGVLIVTGVAGSGKSALLARTVTLSDTRFRADETYRALVAEIPEELQVPEGSVDAAVLARNTDPDELARVLCEALGDAPGRAVPFGAGGYESGHLARLRSLVQSTARQQGEPLTLVVDGIDEARNPTRTITDLLRPLADLRMPDERPAVRLLLGIRSSSFGTSAQGGAPTVRPQAPDLLDLLIRATAAGPPLRTDDPDATPDIAAYAFALLEAPFGDQEGGEVPSASLLDRYGELAETMAREVAPSFLDARIAAQRLRARRTLPDPEDPEWLQTLRQGTEALLREDLLEVADTHSTATEQLMSALRATAFAHGAGLPWADIWPTAVECLSPSPVTDPDDVIRKVWDSRLSGYLITAIEDGRTVYRPVHERISETLRYAPHTLVGAPKTGGRERLSDEEITATHRSLVEAFERLIPRASHHQAPHPYLRRHLVAHSTAAKALDGGHVPTHFLPWETSGTVRGALGLPSNPTSRTLHLASWARIEPFLADALHSARADSLALAAFGMASDYDGIAFSAQDVTVDEAGPTTRSEHDEAPTQPRLAPQWNELRLAGNLLGRSHAPVSSLVSFTLPDGTLLVAAGDTSGEVRLWDPLSGTDFGLPVRRAPYARALAVLAGHQGEPLLAVGCNNGAWLYDPQSGRIDHLPVSVPVHALAVFATAGGSARLALGTTEGLVICDPLVRQVLSRTPRATMWGDSVKALAALRLPTGQPLLAVGGEGSTVEILDAESLRPVIQVAGQGRGVSALALYLDPDGRPRMAAASRSTGSVRNYDAWTGEETAPVIRESAVAICLYPVGPDPRRGMLLALGPSRGGPVRLWDPETGAAVSEFAADHDKRVKGLAILDTGGRPPLLVSGSDDHTVRIWDPSAPASLRATRWEEPSDGSLLAPLPAPGGATRLLRPISIRFLNVTAAATGEVLQQFSLPEEVAPEGLTAITSHLWPNGSVSVIAGTFRGDIFRWDQENGWFRMHDPIEAMERLMPIHRLTRTRALATFRADGTDQVFLASGTSSGTVTFHDLDTREPWSVIHERGAVRALAALPHPDGVMVAFSAAAAVRFCRPEQPSAPLLPRRIGVVGCLTTWTAEDGSILLATGGSDGTVRLWSPEAPRREAYPVLHGHQGPVTAITSFQASPTAPCLLATAGQQDTTVRVWDPRTGDELARVVTGAALTSLCALPTEGDPQLSDPLLAFGGPAGAGAISVKL